MNLERQYSSTTQAKMLKEDSQQSDSCSFSLRSPLSGTFFSGYDELAQSLMMSTVRKSQTNLQTPIEVKSPQSASMRSADLLTDDTPKNDTQYIERHQKIMNKLKDNDVICYRPTHERSRIKFICKTDQCKSSRLGCIHCHLNDHHGHEKIEIQDFCLLFQKNLNHFDKIVLTLSRTIPNRKQIKAEIQEHFQSIKNKILQKLEELEDNLLGQINHAVVVQEPWVHLISEIQNLKNTGLYKMSQQEHQQAIQFIQGSQCDELDRHHQNLLSEVQQKMRAIETSVERYLKELIGDTFFILEDYQTFRVVEENLKEDALFRITVLDKRKLWIDKEIQSLNLQVKLIHQEEIKKVALIKKLKQDQINLSNQLMNAPSRAQLNKDIKFPESCEHLRSCNTVTIFECCDVAYNCIACHGLSDHVPLLSIPSTRQCKKCTRIFSVDYSTSESVSCLNCSQQ